MAMRVNVSYRYAATHPMTLGTVCTQNGGSVVRNNCMMYIQEHSISAGNAGMLCFSIV